MWGKAILAVVKDLKTKVPAQDTPDTSSYSQTEYNYDFSDDRYYGYVDDDYTGGGEGNKATVAPTTSTTTAAAAGGGDGGSTAASDDTPAGGNMDDGFYGDDFARF